MMLAMKARDRDRQQTLSHAVSEWNESGSSLPGGEEGLPTSEGMRKHAEGSIRSGAIVKEPGEPVCIA